MMVHRDIEALQTRLQRVERQIRLVVSGWVVSMAVLLVFFVSVQHVVSRPATLEASLIQVVDRAGKPRIRLGVDPRVGPAVAISDAKGRNRVVLAVSPAGEPALVLRDEVGPRIFLHVQSTGLPEAHLFGENGKGGIALRLEGRGISGLLGVGEPNIVLTDSRGRKRVGLLLDPRGGDPMLGFSDAAGKLRILLSALSDGPVFTLQDAAGRALFQAP